MGTSLRHRGSVVKTDRLAGINAVSEALRSGRHLERVLVVRGGKNPRLQPIIDACRQAGVPVRFEGREALDRFVGGKNHQGVAAIASAATYARLNEVLEKLQKPGLIVVLDGVEDPHNLGAILRSAHAAGADAVVVPERRSAPLSETVAKASAGAIEYLPVCRVKNLNRALKQLKDAGFWVYGLDERVKQPYGRGDYTRHTALVLGGEGKGLHRLTAESCDALVRIPVAGRIASLNVSVAAGIVLFEVVRQRENDRGSEVRASQGESSADRKRVQSRDATEPPNPEQVRSSY